MGDTSIIARRLQDGHVQYGWSGNGGYYKIVGWAIETWYTTPEMVEYLFSLGQLQLLVNPLTDADQHWWYHTTPTGEPHFLGCSENEIFWKVMFVEYAYFYDLENRWYYIAPNNFRIKIPLNEVSKYLEITGKEVEFELFRKLDAHVVRLIADEWYLKDRNFRELADRNQFDCGQAIRLSDKILKDAELDEDDEDYEYWCHLWKYFHDHEWFLEYFDRWVLMQDVGDGTAPAKIIMHKREETREETINWSKEDSKE